MNMMSEWQYIKHEGGKILDFVLKTTHIPFFIKPLNVCVNL